MTRPLRSQPCAQNSETARAQEALPTHVGAPSSVAAWTWAPCAAGSAGTGGGLPAQQAAAPEKPGAPLMKQNADKPTNVKLYPTRGKRPGNREPSSRLALLGGTRVGCDGHRDLRGDCGGDGLATVCACTHIFERYT